MKKLWFSKMGILLLIPLLVLINVLSNLFHARIDLTAEKRYTLSEPTKTLLKNLSSPVHLTIFLSGDMPAGFKKLANSTGEMLQEFKDYGKGNITYSFEKPGDGLSEDAKNAFIDSLNRLGLSPMNVKAQTKTGESREEQYIYPGALVTYQGKQTAIDFLQGQSAVDGINSLNNAEALLEYKLAGTIHKLTQDSLPWVGYLAGNGESMSYNVYDLVNTLKASYHFRFVPIDQVGVIPDVFAAILIVKPTQPFTDQQKLKIDQYVMHGGKAMWLIDNLYAEYDSLQRSQHDFVAFDRGLNIDDQLFKYGVRINTDLVLDLNSDQLPSVVGSVGGKPQMELLPWPYFPLLINTNGHPIAKNLDYIVSQFPSSIDTVKAGDLKKTILLSTSGQAKTLSSPAKVTLQALKTKEDYDSYTKKDIPIAVLLEGKFTSLFANRLTTAMRDSLAANQMTFMAAGGDDGKMIVASDGDIALNEVSQKQGPLTMGRNLYTGYQYANKDFMMNSIEYLTDKSGILQTRSKDFTLRLLDKTKVEDQRSFWQVITIVVPVVLIIVFGSIYQYIQRRRFQPKLRKLPVS
ncbi:MAG: gliding motility-associated ABC transporter substrate-binding protein GldG [Chitinophagaceae bacterium]